MELHLAGLLHHISFACVRQNMLFTLYAGNNDCPARIAEHIDRGATPIKQSVHGQNQAYSFDWQLYAGQNNGGSHLA